MIEGNSSQEDSGNNVNILSGKENLKCMMKEILNEELTKQEENLRNLINGHFQTNRAKEQS